MQPISVIQMISRAHDQLRKSERKVADYVLAHPEEVIHMRIVDLAQEARVSEPTVVRFCRAIGANSFQAFKVGLAQYVAHHPAAEVRPIAEAPPNITLHGDISLLQQLSESLDEQLVTTIAGHIVRARRIIVAGGSSATLDAQRVLLDAGLPAVTFADLAQLRLEAPRLTALDILLVIEEPQLTPEFTDIATLARETGARVIVVGRAQTPLAEAADDLIPLAALASDELSFTALRLQQTAVIGLLGASLGKHIQSAI
ncbi:MAG: MurR/RpiR family transcriptional regulator [Spongiibacteraceae bacterium]|jgi:RpiR family carbohydrate utilization transcriptional regulator|nr:MurR/RpiR family transcriptional regulator [Spongiibacteraceae bacterium]